MSSSNQAFHRLELLTGNETLGKLAKARTILLGVGGVGSWCAEGLIRSGIHDLTIVDSDLVCITNINRQLQATSRTIGKAKVVELGERLKEINPAAQIHPLKMVYDRTTAVEFNLDEYDYIIDAIDGVSSKVELIANALSSQKAKLFSALGASCKVDPTRIRISSIWKSHGCKLGRFVRKRLRQRGVSGDFQCVWSDELLRGYDIESACGTGDCFCPKLVLDGDDEEAAHEWCSSKKQINGSAVHITALFGFMLSGLVVQDIMQKSGPAS